MAIGSSDLIEVLSTSAGSTGGAISGSTVTSGVANNVWANITSAEASSGITVYRKTFWKNQHATDAAVLPIMYVPTLPSNATLSIGLGFDDANDNDPAQGNMVAFSANALASAISDGADTRTCTYYGLNSTGTPTTETVTLTGAVEVLSTTLWSKLLGVKLSGTDASRTVSIRQGSGGTERGNIPISKVCCWLWVASPSTKAAGIAMPNLGAGQSYGMWRRLVIAAGASAVRPNLMTVQIEENG